MVYIAEFEMPDRRLLQGLIHLKTPSESPVTEADAWHRQLGHVLRLTTSCTDVGLSLRITAQGDSLDRVLLLTASARRETLFRRGLAAFTRLETIADDTVQIPLDREAHDGYAEQFPQLRLFAGVPSYYAGAYWLSCRLHVWQMLPDLLREARLYDFLLSYQANILPVSINREWIRQARLNLTRLEARADVSQKILSSQRAAVERLEAGTAVVDEYLGVDDPDAAAWLTGRLDRRFESTAGILGFPLPGYEFLPDVCADELASGFHRCLIGDLDTCEISNAIITDAERDGILALGLGDTGPHEPPAGPGRARKNDPVQPPPSGEFLFISYKHDDTAKVIEVIEEVGGWGYGTWYDDGIPGGAEWDEVIEQRIEDCQLVLIFLSNQAVRSKYVRREVKFADTLGKPLIGICLEPVNLAAGLKMLMQQYQMLFVDKADFSQKLRDALNHHYPRP